MGKKAAREQKRGITFHAGGGAAWEVEGGGGAEQSAVRCRTCNPSQMMDLQTDPKGGGCCSAGYAPFEG